MLIRWQHPTRGVIPPGAFIPAAESIGAIVPSGRWVLRTACLQAAAWRQRGTPISVSVNVSPEQLHDERLVFEVGDALAAADIDPSSLCLEITESTLMRDPDRAESILGELKALGVHLAIDDFGTGYSSLAYLHPFPFDVLKIDRSFTARMMSVGGYVGHGARPRLDSATTSGCRLSPRASRICSSSSSSNSSNAGSARDSS